MTSKSYREGVHLFNVINLYVSLYNFCQTCPTNINLGPAKQTTKGRRAVETCYLTYITTAKLTVKSAETAGR